MAVLVPQCQPQCAPVPPAPPAVTVPARGMWLRLPTVWPSDRLDEVVDRPDSQSAVDAGHIVNWSGCQPGVCTVWLAGHRSTHGAVFAAIPSLRAGDRIELIVDGVTLTYRVASISLVCCWGDPYTPGGDLILQTSASGGRARIVTAVAT